MRLILIDCASGRSALSAVACMRGGKSACVCACLCVVCADPSVVADEDEEFLGSSKDGSHRRGKEKKVADAVLKPRRQKPGPVL